MPQARLEQYGPKPVEGGAASTFLQTSWEQLNNFVVILLIVASVISGLARRLDAKPPPSWRSSC
ncbi:MAG: cation-transporting P-type ATPase [Ignavibacteriales bacterium]|nr:cation-transporting P-type ATPase [Ignavibacteriales bacterium]